MATCFAYGQTGSGKTHVSSCLDHLLRNLCLRQQLVRRRQTIYVTELQKIIENQCNRNLSTDAARSASERLNSHLFCCCGLSTGRSPPLRSSSTNSLLVPRTRTCYGDRNIAVASLAAWNDLPAELTDSSLSLSAFRKLLKTELGTDFLVH